MNEEIQHIPVFGLNIVELLQVKDNSVILDCTCGEGGHASIFLSLIKEGYYYGFDRDECVLEIAKRRLSKIANNFRLFHDTYANANKQIEHARLEKPNILIADLGISMYQLKTRGRGFSFQTDDPLDMRFDGSDVDLRAHDVVNKYPEKKLADIIYEFGEERASRRIAYKIVRERNRKPIETCSQLASIIASAKGYKRGKIHPATQTFQALRIEVNQEMVQLQNLLKNLPDLVAENGTIAFISYHSIEDRIIKHFIRESVDFTRVNKKVIRPLDEEIAVNPAARSAKLRIGTRNAKSSK